VHEAVSNVLRELMAARLLDLAIVPYDPAPMAGYEQTTLLREPLVLVGPASQKLAERGPVPLASLDGLKFVVPGRPNVARVQIEKAMERKGMQFRLALESDTLQLCLSLVRRGIGHTVVPASSLYGIDANQDLSWAPVKGQFVTWAALENTARSHSRSVREARKLLIRTVADALRLDLWPGAEPVGDSLAEHMPA
jgi:LysR family transcriptional regulator, nitrogen assimilation regulatory protein